MFTAIFYFCKFIENACFSMGVVLGLFVIK